MKFTLRTKKGNVTIDTENPGNNIFKSDSPVFKAVEGFFDWWAKNQASREEKEMYFGSFEEMGGESYLSKRDAIKAGVWAVIEWAEENEKRYFSTTAFWQIDFAAVFQA